MSLDSPSRRPDDLVETIRDLDRRLRALESANRLTSASIGSGGLTVRDGGDILVDGGQIQIKSNGNFANLAGINANELAAAQVGFEVSTTETVIVSATATRPSWATTAVVFVAGVCSAGNTTGAQDTLWVRAVLETDDGQSHNTAQFQDTKLDGQQAQGGVPSAEIFDMTSGASSVTAKLQIEAKNATWAFDSNNFARIDGTVLWLGQPAA